MKRLLLLCCMVLTLWLGACAPSPQTPASEVTATFTVTAIPAQPTATPTSIPTEPPATASPAPLDKGYAVEEERQIGDYVVRLWRNTASEGLSFDNVATLSGPGKPEVRPGKPEVRIEQVAELGAETGTDLTGEGNPDVVFRVYTGGAHCCFSTVVYDLGPTLIKVLETPLSNCDGRFEDLDGDGVAEYVTCDDRFAYAYCAYAGSPAVQVVLQYDPEQGYVPASPHFVDHYARAIAKHTQQAESARPGEMGEWDATAKCGVLPLVLDYLYTGQQDRAWQAFSQYYDEPDALLFWTEIVQAADDSPLYTPGEKAADVPWPEHYMLQLVPACGPDELQQAVRVLDEGQSPGPQAPCRDLYWLQAQLLRAGILAEGEMLVLAPEGCTDVCRLDVIRASDNTPLGGIRLDTEVGFPGAVYRVDGQAGEAEGERWRLRGDLTWERVPE
jgi:hypothetical protein